MDRQSVYPRHNERLTATEARPRLKAVVSDGEMDGSR